MTRGGNRTALPSRRVPHGRRGDRRRCRRRSCRARPHRLLSHWRRPAVRHRQRSVTPASSASARKATPSGTPSRDAVPNVGDTVRVEVDWDRRHALMRTHTRAARAVWRDLERVEDRGHRRQHGAAVGTDGLRVRPLAGRVRTPSRAAGQRRDRRRPPDRGVVPAAGDRGRGRRSHPHEGQHDPRVGEGDSRRRHRRARQASRRWHARSHARTRSVAFVWSRPSRRARATSGFASRSSMAELEALRTRLRDFDSIVVAFSGGADSAFLAWVANDTLGDRPRVGSDGGLAITRRRGARRLPRVGGRMGVALA